MNLRLQKIEESVKKYLNKNSTPQINNLREGVLWFDRVLNYNCGINDLDGINITLLDAIEDLYVRQDNPRKALTTIATETETYLEKIVFLLTGKDYTGNTSKTLINMVDELNLSNAVTNRNCSAKDFFTEEQINNFIGSPDFTEHIARTYKKRNDIIHNSPLYDLADIYVISRSLLITMLLQQLSILIKLKK